MPRYDVTDEAFIDAAPAEVYHAVLDELRGETHWWMPDWEAHLREGKPIEQRGAITDITVHHRGTPHFSARVMQVRENELIDLTLPEGDFQGYGEWTFEPAGPGTRVRFHLVTRPHRLLYKLAALFIDLGERHSRWMRQGLENLSCHLARDAGAAG